MMSEHSWCRDIDRDEAVRAAEDNRTGPLPTLEECIGMLPKTGSASSASEQQNKGNDIATNGLLTAEERDAVAGIALVIDRLKLYPEQLLRTKKDDLDLLWRIAEGKARSAPAASGAAWTEPVSSDPVAWGVMLDGKIDQYAGADSLFIDKTEAEGWCGAASPDGKATVVPLYAAPQPAPGWLTAEERGVVERVRDHLFDSCQLEFTDIVALDHLLARDTPPEVVRPGKPLTFRYGDDAMANRDGQWIASLDAAGIKVKEVG